MIKEYILPCAVLAAEKTTGADNLLKKHTDMATFVAPNPCVIAPQGYVVLDFGKEYGGGVRVILHEMGGKKNARVRIRFGESAMECYSDVGYKGATNDHSVRDEVLTVPFLGVLEYGRTGYRFIRIDNVDDVPITFLQIEGIYEHSGKKIVGEFTCSDALVNDVFSAGVRTIYLNDNDLITDGVKRDRLVWIGDMHPESSAILRIFGYDEAICRSLDFARDCTPPDSWMNTIPTYTMWWIKILRDMFIYLGNKDYLAKQIDYLKACVKNIVSTVREDGLCEVPSKFVDWPTFDNENAQNCGLYAMLVIAMKSAIDIFSEFGENEYVELCENTLTKIRRFTPDYTTNKQMAALLCFAGEISPEKVNKEVLAVNPYDGISAFLCYYVMIARAKAGDMNGALDLIKEYYGAMLKLGSTTLWEDFDLEWVKGAKPIDSILKDGEYDVHGDNGKYCYQGYRHSLCHGWSAGAVPFLSEYVLGVKVLSPDKIEISPSLGYLKVAEGKVPLAKGVMEIMVENAGGELLVSYTLPKGVKATLKGCKRR